MDDLDEAKCPECGDEDRQRRIGRLHYRSAAVFHCEACDHLYAVEDTDDEPAEGDD